MCSVFLLRRTPAFGGSGPIVDFPNVRNRAAQFNFNLVPILAFTIVPKGHFSADTSA